MNDEVKAVVFTSSFLVHTSSFLPVVNTFVKESFIRAAPERVFAFHEQPDALALLTPPWETSRVVRAARISEVGSSAVVETRVLGFLPVRWVARHTLYDPPRSFEDVQERGPFHCWRHRHVVLPHAEGATLRDEIEYEPPLGVLGRIAEPFLVRPRLEKLFAYRHAVTREWCEREPA
ncbi:MAG: SRPBCC family protein [Acidobacteria bacterium]|nr:SRPBCC family protein [Acidobacteriota bacterium]MCA1642558.1 SRPBCC family protein [Acidobacteriota bacterium]